ncbi:MAG: DNA/RNA non-specific endonuclease [Firmicutes bacterium]|nr:DNA/RNA non-specific endonuclease [Bacillota bacterium]
MKKKILAAVIILAIGAACFFGYRYITEEKKGQESPENTVSQVQEAKDHSEMPPQTDQTDPAASDQPQQPSPQDTSKEPSAEPEKSSLGWQPPEDPYLGNDPALQEHPKAPELTWIRDLEVPEYSGKAYVPVNGNLPFFDTEGLVPKAWEVYYDLDELGRCTLADAVAGPETMPTEKRGSISSVKPTGWHSDRYPAELVNGGALYNRCHLIAFGICGETANKYNLVTGTRYFNTDGINSFENMIIDYIRETGNHVRIRVTPVFKDDELICRGQVAEAWSIEDDGDGIAFCIYSYNVQPGIVIDYATGDNRLADEDASEAKVQEPAPDAPEKSAGQKEPQEPSVEFPEGTYILNIRSKKIHMPDCPGAVSISDKNKRIHTGSLDGLLEEGYTADPFCMGTN